MKEVNNVKELRDYGKINIKLDEQMKKKDINIYRLSQVTELSYNTIRAYKENKPITRVDLDVLARLCYSLDWNVCDLLEYKK